MTARRLIVLSLLVASLLLAGMVSAQGLYDAEDRSPPELVPPGAIAETETVAPNADMRLASWSQCDGENETDYPVTPREITSSDIDLDCAPAGAVVDSGPGGRCEIRTR